MSEPPCVQHEMSLHSCADPADRTDMGIAGINGGAVPVDGRDLELLDRARSVSARQLADRIVETDLAAIRDGAARSRRRASEVSFGR